MINYYIEKDNQILLFDTDKTKIETTLKFTPQYVGLEILETERPIVDFKFADTEEYLSEVAQKESERIAMLHLTRGDVFRALLKAKGVTRVQLRAGIEANTDLTDVQKELALIDFDEALEFYRGVELVDVIGTSLGISSEQMTTFFETNDYTYLVTSDEGK